MYSNSINKEKQFSNSFYDIYKRQEDNLQIFVQIFAIPHQTKILFRELLKWHAGRKIALVSSMQGNIQQNVYKSSPEKCILEKARVFGKGQPEIKLF